MIIISRPVGVIIILIKQFSRTDKIIIDSHGI